MTMSIRLSNFGQQTKRCNHTARYCKVGKYFPYPKYDFPTCHIKVIVVAIIRRTHQEVRDLTISEKGCCWWGGSRPPSDQTRQNSTIRSIRISELDSAFTWCDVILV